MHITNQSLPLSWQIAGASGITLTAVGAIAIPIILAAHLGALFLFPAITVVIIGIIIASVTARYALQFFAKDKTTIPSLSPPKAVPSLPSSSPPQAALPPPSSPPITALPTKKPDVTCQTETHGLYFYNDAVRIEFGWLFKYKPVEEFLNENSPCPKQLRDFINTSLIKCTAPTFSVVNLTYPHIASPNLELIRHRADKYRKKYGIQIELIREQERDSKLLEKKNKRETGGLIIYDEDCEVGHVTPILYHFEANYNEVVNLDTTGVDGNRCHAKLRELANIFPPESRVELFVSRKDRQSDGYSCRTEAPGILLRGLLHLMKRKQDGLDCSFRDCGFTIKEKKGNIIEFTELPPEWDYIDQISNKSEGALQKEAIRDHFSKKPARRAQVRTVGEFRKMHTNRITCSYEMKIPTIIASLIPGFDSLNTLSLPPGIKLSINPALTSISWGTDEREVNTYLQYKGFANARESNL